MGEFRGTYNELLKYINPYLRNIIGVQNITDYDIEQIVLSHILDNYKPLKEGIYFIDLDILCNHVIKVKFMENQKTDMSFAGNQDWCRDYLVESASLNLKNNYDILFKIKEETFQNYIKRLFTFLSFNNLLDEDLLTLLQDKTYCQLAFGIDYPLLIKDSRKIKDRNGHNRYWTKFKLNNMYYVCSEWWKDKFSFYEDRLYDWINLKFVK